MISDRPISTRHHPFHYRPEHSWSATSPARDWVGFGSTEAEAVAALEYVSARIAAGDWPPGLHDGSKV